MSLHYREDGLYLDDMSCEDLARQFGTPCFVYSKQILLEQWSRLRRALAPLDFNSDIHYAVKANNNLSVLALFAQQGVGFDIVSGGEMMKVMASGGQASRMIFSGVGKSREEIAYTLKNNIGCLNIESLQELLRVEEIASELGCVAPIALRVNPDVDAKTHEYISTGLRSNKFGIAWSNALDMCHETLKLPHLALKGLACHIGSQIVDPSPLAEAAKKIAHLADTLANEGVVLGHLDIGGGLGLRYRDEVVQPIDQFLAAALAPFLHRKEKIILAPGRWLVAECGILLTRVEYLKDNAVKHFAVMDAAMNDLIRPALYQAWHEVMPVLRRNTATRIYDVVGPICESGDFLAKDRPLAITSGDLLAFANAGAYGMSLSSNYNTRPKAAEVLVEDGRARLIRRRELVESLWSDELPENLSNIAN